MLRNSTVFGLANTTSFRRSSKKIFGRWGSNLQNSGKTALTIYHPSRDDYELTQPDQAGAEALVVAYLTEHGKFRDLFLNGIKSHTYVASHIFRNKWRRDGFTDIEQLNINPISSLPNNDSWKKLSKVIKNSDREYFIGKKSCHSFNYRMRPPTFQEDVLKESEGEVDLTKEESQEFHRIYHNLFPEISLGWWPEIEKQVKQTGYLFNLFGYPFYCQGPYTEKTWRELTAIVPQSTVGCITAIAICELQEYIEREHVPWNILNDKHDSLLLENPISHREHVKVVLKKCIEQELVNFRGEHFRMKSEISIGQNWGKYDAVKNPEGMREI